MPSFEWLLYTLAGCTIRCFVEASKENSGRTVAHSSARLPSGCVQIAFTPTSTATAWSSPLDPLKTRKSHKRFALTGRTKSEHRNRGSAMLSVPRTHNGDSG